MFPYVFNSGWRGILRSLDHDEVTLYPDIIENQSNCIFWRNQVIIVSVIEFCVFKTHSMRSIFIIRNAAILMHL